MVDPPNGTREALRAFPKSRAQERRRHDLRYSGVLVVLVLTVSMAWAEPIDPHAFGLLTRGMSQTAVVARVGEPDVITDLGRTATVSRSRHGSGLVIREQLREAWVYVGTSRILTTRLIFANGVLVAKDKGR